MEDYHTRLNEIIFSEEWLLEILRIVRSLDLPDCFVAAGVIRNTIWDRLHGFSDKTPLNDVDVVYYDPTDMEGIREKEFESILKNSNNNINWEVVNQARGHMLTDDREKDRLPAKNTTESIAYWSETPTCVGVRLEKDNSLTICAPHGINDLMELIVRPIPEPYRDMNLFNKRVNNKGWVSKWPRLKIIS